MLSEKDISINASDVKICKYGSGLLFGLEKSGDKVEKKDKVKKLSKKEQKIINMKPQRGIFDTANSCYGGEMVMVEKKKSTKTSKQLKLSEEIKNDNTAQLVIDNAWS